MPTAQFNSTDSHLYYGGNWFNNSAGGRVGFIAWAYNPQWDFSFTGTQFSFPYFTNGPTTPITITVDGVASTPTLTANAWTIYTSATLAEGAHAVTVKNTNGTFFWLDTTPGTGGVTITGASPALNALGDLGPQTKVNNAGSVASGFQVLGGWATINNSNGSAGYQSSWMDAQVRFYATASSFRVYCQNIGLHNDGSTVGTKVRLSVDGVDSGQVGTVTVQGVAGTVPDSTTSAQWGYASFSGLDGTAQHLYALTFSDSNRICAVYSVSTAGTINTSATFPALTYWAAYGDSIVEGLVGTACDSSLAWPHLLGTAKGNTYVYNRGVGGTTVSSTFSGASSGQSRTADITGLSPSPANVFVLYGSNDVGIGAVPSATFQSAYQAMMNSLTTGLPSAHFYCLGIIPRGDKTAAQIAVYNAALQSALAALTTAQQAQITYVDTSAWNLAGSAYNTGGSFTASPNFSPLSGGFAPDNLHPGPFGNAVIESHLMSLLSPAAVPAPNPFLPAHLRTPHGRTRVGPGVKSR